ncbi:MAG: PASTA domain-containing protein [Propionibacteriaceae bacterium]|jgi:beta-lactam-binding protein with PASTA domain|nr:PASTA domain-containing protein [Propionibacteriaceae bacterium]
MNTRHIKRPLLSPITTDEEGGGVPTAAPAFIPPDTDAPQPGTQEEPPPPATETTLKNPRRLSRKILTRIGIAALAAIVVIVGITITVDQVTRVTIPDVLGQSPTDAQAALQSLNLTNTPEITGSCATQPSTFGDHYCTVTDITPQPAARVHTDAPITLTITLIDVTVPNTVGLTFAAAKSTLAKQGLNNVLEANTPKPTQDSWLVASQTPSAETTTQAGASIRLTLEIPPVTMPDVIGLPLAQAKTSLEGIGLKPIFSPEKANGEGIKAGLVTQASSAAGAAVEYGATVTLTWGLKVPNVVGMVLSDAKAALDSVGIDFSVDGRKEVSETVTAQGVAPDAMISFNDTLVITTRPEATTSQKQAEKQARSYLKHSAFSRSGLIHQLEYEGYSTEDSTYAVDGCNVDWNEQADKQAASYLKHSSFSRSSLIHQLEYEGYSTEQATHGVDSVGL